MYEVGSGSTVLRRLLFLAGWSSTAASWRLAAINGRSSIFTASAISLVGSRAAFTDALSMRALAGAALPSERAPT